MTFSLFCVFKCKVNIPKDTNKHNYTIPKLLIKHNVIYFTALIYSIITSKIKQEKYEQNYKIFVIITTKDFLDSFFSSYSSKMSLLPRKQNNCKNMYYNFHVTTEILQFFNGFPLRINLAFQSTTLYIDSSVLF